jgi:hypothetical protein
MGSDEDEYSEKASGKHTAILDCHGQAGGGQ